MKLEKPSGTKNSQSADAVCTRCGADEGHMACPVCAGRGCISGREVAERLGMREALDAAELTADAVAKAVDGKVLECFEAARKVERERSEQVLLLERKRLGEAERRLQEQIKTQGDQLLELRQLRAEAEARAKQAEEAFAKRR